MIATTKLRQRADILRHSALWPATIALCALAPKCFLCVAAYIGLGAALGMGGREICGGPAGVTEVWVWVVLLTGTSLGVVGTLVLRRSRRYRFLG